MERLLLGVVHAMSEILFFSTRYGVDVPAEVRAAFFAANMFTGRIGEWGNRVADEWAAEQAAVHNARRVELLLREASEK